MRLFVNKFNANNNDAFKIEGVCKYYGDNAALDALDLAINSGELIAITGASGSGKSTLLNQLSGLDQPTSGKITLLGEEFSLLSVDERTNIRNANIGIIFQQYHLVPYLTAVENVILPLKYKYQSDKVDNIERVRELFNDFNMLDTLDKYPNQLSGGQQQRICIIRALANNPNIIIADEPTAALDPLNSKIVFDNLKSLHKKGHTVIVVTHDIDLANKCNRVINLDKGRLISDKIINNDSNEEICFNSPSTSNRFDCITMALHMAKRSLKGKPIQTFLSMLAIAMGIFSLILMNSLGEGAKQEILDDLSHLSSSRVSVNSYLSSYSLDGLVSNDLNTIQSKFDIEVISPYVYKQANIRDVKINVLGVNNNYLKLTESNLIQGKYLSRFNVVNGEQVVVISRSLSKTLGFDKFKTSINQYLTLGSGVYKIIGEVTDTNDYDSNYAYIPYTTLEKYFEGVNSYDKIIFSVKNSLPIDHVTSYLISYFSGRDAIVIESDLETEKILLSTTEKLTYLVVSISVVTLLVGGIGTMNIMLSSVRERLSEIGIRVSLGATPLDIKLQFLLESILICIFGGILGCFMYVISYLFLSVFFTSFSLLFSFSTLVLSLLFSGCIGALLGYVPASKATKLNPLECLNL